MISAAFVVPAGRSFAHRRKASTHAKSCCSPTSPHPPPLLCVGGGGGGSGGGWTGNAGWGRNGGGDSWGNGSARSWNLLSAPLMLGSLAMRGRRAPRRRTPSGNFGSNTQDAVRQFLRRLRVSHVLLAVNVAVFLLQGVMGSRLLMAGAKVNSEIAAGQWYRLVTPMFLHASVTHLLVNAFSLYSTGPSVESWFGRRRFAALYLMSGIGGNLLSFLCTPTPSVGASGAIFGLVGATAVLLARHRRILGPRSRKGLNSLAYIMMVNFGMGMSRGSRIDNFGHLGGLLGGVLFAYLIGPRLVETRSREGKLVLADVPLYKVATAEAKVVSRSVVGKLGSIARRLGPGGDGRRR